MPTFSRPKSLRLLSIVCIVSMLGECKGLIAPGTSVYRQQLGQVRDNCLYLEALNL